MKKGRFQEAWKSMMLLRRNPIQVARDIYYINAQLEIEKELAGRTNYVTRFTQLFTIPRVRRANLAAFTVMIAQQMCGECQERPSSPCPSAHHLVRYQHHCVLLDHHF